MAQERAADRVARNGGLLGSLRTLATTLVDLIQARLDLLANEFEEERIRLQQMLLLAAIAFFCAAMGLLLLTLLIVVLFWDTHRVAALALIALGYVVAAAAAYGGFSRRAAAKPKLFSSSLAEFAKDRQWLRSR